MSLSNISGLKREHKRVRVWKHAKGKNINNDTFQMEQKLFSILAPLIGSEVSIIPPEGKKKKEIIQFSKRETSERKIWSPNYK